MKIIKTKDYIMGKAIVVVGAKKVSAAELALKANKLVKEQEKKELRAFQLKENDAAAKKAKELSSEKTLSNNANSTVKDNVPDVVLMGAKINNWRLMCKAFSNLFLYLAGFCWEIQEPSFDFVFRIVFNISAGLIIGMKSTKGLNLSTNQVLIQTTTQQKNSDGSYSIADTLIAVNGNLIESDEKGIFIITI